MTVKDIILTEMDDLYLGGLRQNIEIDTWYSSESVTVTCECFKDNLCRCEDYGIGDYFENCALATVSTYVDDEKEKRFTTPRFNDKLTVKSVVEKYLKDNNYYGLMKIDEDGIMCCCETGKSQDCLRLECKVAKTKPKAVE